MKVIYNDKIAEVLDKNETHFLIKFKNGTKLCTRISAFNNNEIINKK